MTVARLNLQNSLIVETASQITEICKPLNRLGISYFRYMVRYPDYSRGILSNRPEIIQYCYEEGLYPITWYDNNNKTNDSYQAGAIIWAIQKLINAQQEQDYQNDPIINSFKINHGISFLIKYKNYLEIFEFASPQLDIYYINPMIFKRFIFYFREQACRLIPQIHNEKIFLPNNVKCEKQTVTKKSLSNEFFHQLEKQLHIKKFFLPGIDKNFYLTNREFHCMKVYIQSGSAKKTAQQLGISAKTVLRHLENIKGKSEQSNLLDIAKELGFFAEDIF